MCVCAWCSDIVILVNYADCCLYADETSRFWYSHLQKNVNKSGRLNVLLECVGSGVGPYIPSLQEGSSVEKTQGGLSSGGPPPGQ